MKAEDYYGYLDNLRKSGATNMYGAPAYLERDFDLSAADARDAVQSWMKTYSGRHPA